MSRVGDEEVAAALLTLRARTDDLLLDALDEAIDRWAEGGQQRDDGLKLLDLLEEAKSRFGELPEELELLEVAVTGRLLSPWLPHGAWRKVAMLGFFGLGWLAFFTPYQWLLWSFLVCLAFSPRVAGKMAVWAGRRSAGRARNPD